MVKGFGGHVLESGQWHIRDAACPVGLGMVIQCLLIVGVVRNKIGGHVRQGIGCLLLAKFSQENIHFEDIVDTTVQWIFGVGIDADEGGEEVFLWHGFGYFRIK